MTADSKFSEGPDLKDKVKNIVAAHTLAFIRTMNDPTSGIPTPDDIDKCIDHTANDILELIEKKPW
jgi:hypothetical protein